MALLPFSSPQDFEHRVRGAGDAEGLWFVFRGDRLLVEIGPPDPRPGDDPRVRERPSWAHPGKCLFLELAGAPHAAAVVSELEPGLAPTIGLSGDLDSEVAIAEVCLDALLAAERRGSAYRPLPRFPGIKVDVAVAVPESTRAGALIALIETAGKGQVADVELFDLYRGQSIGEGRKSLAFHVLLQSDARTLTDQDEQKFLQRFEKLVADAGGELRKA